MFLDVIVSGAGLGGKFVVPIPRFLAALLYRASRTVKHII